MDAACAEREEVRARLADADRALSQARAESACRCSQNRTLLGKLAAAQVPLHPTNQPAASCLTSAIKHLMFRKH